MYGWEACSMGGGSKAQGDAPVLQIRRKRQRRLASQIERKHPCSFSGCKKSYGSEGALKLHVRRKHSSNHRAACPRPLARAPPVGWVSHSHIAPSGTAYTPIVPDSGISGLHSLDMAAHWDQQVALQLQAQQQFQHGIDQRHLQGSRGASSSWPNSHYQSGLAMPQAQPHRPAVLHLGEPPARHAAPAPDTNQGGMYSNLSVVADGLSCDLSPSPNYAPSPAYLFCSPHYQHMAIASQLSKIQIGSWIQHLHPETGLVFSVDDIRRDLCYTVELPQMLLRIVVGFESVASIKADTQTGETHITVQVKDSPAFYKTDPSVVPATWTMTEDFTNVEFAEQLFSVLLSDNYFKDQSQNDSEESPLYHEDAAQHPKERTQRPLIPHEPTHLQFTPITPPVLPPGEAGPQGSSLPPTYPAAIEPVPSLEQERRRQRQLRQRQRRQHSQRGPMQHQRREEGSPAANGLNQPALQQSLGRGRVGLLLNDCESILKHHVDETFEDSTSLTNTATAEEASSLYDTTFDWADTMDYANQLPIPQLR